MGNDSKKVESKLLDPAFHARKINFNFDSLLKEIESIEWPKKQEIYEDLWRMEQKNRESIRRH